MPVPRLIAAFLTEGYYADHVGTLQFSSSTSNTHEQNRSGTGKHHQQLSSPTDRMLLSTSSSLQLSISGQVNANNSSQQGTSEDSLLVRQQKRKASFAVLRALKDLSDEAQEDVIELPSNTILFMNPLTKDMGVSAIRASVPKKYLPLYSSAVTPAPLDSYIHQILTFLRSEEEEFLIALVLLAKVSTRIPICNLSVARMFLTAMVVASKLRADERLSMKAYATFGGVEVSDMAAMERAFLTAIGFDAGVRPEQYADMVYSLRHYCVVAASEGVDWIIEAWSDLAPKIPVPDLRHLTAAEACESEGEEAEVGVVTGCESSSAASPTTPTAVNNNNNSEEETQAKRAKHTPTAMENSQPDALGGVQSRRGSAPQSAAQEFVPKTNRSGSVSSSNTGASTTAAAASRGMAPPPYSAPASTSSHMAGSAATTTVFGCASTVVGAGQHGPLIAGGCSNAVAVPPLHPHPHGTVAPQSQQHYQQQQYPQYNTHQPPYHQPQQQIVYDGTAPSALLIHPTQQRQEPLLYTHSHAGVVASHTCAAILAPPTYVGVGGGQPVYVAPLPTNATPYGDVAGNPYIQQQLQQQQQYQQHQQMQPPQQPQHLQQQQPMSHQPLQAFYSHDGGKGAKPADLSSRSSWHSSNGATTATTGVSVAPVASIVSQHHRPVSQWAAPSGPYSYHPHQQDNVRLSYQH